LLEQISFVVLRACQLRSRVILVWHVSHARLHTLRCMRRAQYPPPPERCSVPSPGGRRNTAATPGLKQRLFSAYFCRAYCYWLRISVTRHREVTTQGVLFMTIRHNESRLCCWVLASTFAKCFNG